MKKIITTIFTILILLSTWSQVSDNMLAHYINVGQGNAALLEFPCGAVLIDAGAQDEEHADKLIEYLDHFFSKRDDLNRTIDLIIITHAHLDHNLALDRVIKNFTVKNYIDNGERAGSGKKNQKWAQDNAAAYDCKYEGITNSKVITGGNKNGYTNAVIDPINCEGIDPKITILTGAFKTKPSGWNQTDFTNGNNHSVVIKVEYEGASFLFMGDLEEKGIATMVNYYSSTDILDCDVILVGHHGSHNATTEELLNAVTPTNAVISCGRWNFGLNSGNKFTTYAYGHPRKNIIELLSSHISGTRSKSIQVKVAEASRVFKTVTITKRIYVTPWDNNIIVSATKTGTYRITTGN
jgi:competence protein ComEC